MQMETPTASMTARRCSGLPPRCLLRAYLLPSRQGMSPSEQAPQCLVAIPPPAMCLA